MQDVPRADAFGETYWRLAGAVAKALGPLTATDVDRADFRLLVDNLPTLCWIANGDGYIVWYNRRWYDYTGAKPADMEGWGWQSVHDPETLPDVLERWTKSIAAAETFEMTFPLKGADGVFCPFLTRIVPLKDATGKVVRWFGNNIDVAAQQRTESALRESQERLSLAMSAGSGIGSWDWDLQTGLVIADERFATLYRVDPQKAKVGAPIGDFFTGVHPDDLPRTQASITHALRTGERFHEEYRLVQADGSILWVAAQGRCVMSPAGKALRFPGVVFDITDRKKTEILRLALVNLGNLIRDIEQPADLAFAASQIVGEAMNVSRAGYGTIDRAAETITVEKDWNAAGVRSIAGVLRFRDYGSYIGDLKAGKTVVVENTETDPRTSKHAAALKKISVQSFVNMPVSEQGNFAAIIFVNHATPRAWTKEELDFIAEVGARTRTAIARLEAEYELRALAASLEKQVEDRTADLRREALERQHVEEALRQSQKMEAVGQLTGGLAHDFNNLLMGISGSLEMIGLRIQQGKMDAVDRYVTGAQGAVKRAAALTHRLLAFSRQQTLDPKPTNVNRLIGDIEELIRRTVGPSVHIEVVGAGGIWPTLVDRHQLENALLNLCINARDAMPDGGRLTIETANKWLDDRAAKERELPPGQYISLCVTDTGTGMTPEVAAKAFDPFFTTKPIGQGTGLGLSMIYGFARQSGGQVRIYSEVGKGTTMCIYLPRHDTGPEAETAREAVAAKREGDGETVLVIEDEPTIRMLIVEVLEDAGYKALQAWDGPAGMKILQSSAQIDLLITDVGLPGGMNGRQIADAARVVRRGLKVLFITGYAENAAIGNGILDTGMHIVTKPFAIDDLSRKIREIIET